MAFLKFGIFSQACFLPVLAGVYGLAGGYPNFRHSYPTRYLPPLLEEEGQCFQSVFTSLPYFTGGPARLPSCSKHDLFMGLFIMLGEKGCISGTPIAANPRGRVNPHAHIRLWHGKTANRGQHIKTQYLAFHINNM